MTFGEAYWGSIVKINQNSKFYKLAKWLNALLVSMKFYIRYTVRILGLPNVYQNMKNYKGIHKGERCFIIATGPSLTLEDIKKLQKEKTFGMNSLCKIFPETGWETTYFGIQDYRVFRNFKEDIELLENTTIFMGDSIKGCKGAKSVVCKYPINYLNHRYRLKTQSAKFSGDCYKEVYDGYSIAYSLLQIAVYMGFSEIYLLGADCNYRKQEKLHFIETGNVSAEDTGDRIIFAYQEAKKYCDEHGIHVYNATRGGCLYVFPRVDLDEIL